MIKTTAGIESSAAGLRFNQLAGLIGRTPLLDLTDLSPDPERVRIYAKAEWFNPGGSVKDRPALWIIREAVRQNRLRPGIKLLDASSGNTALAYAMLGAALGYGITLFVPDNVSPLQKALLKAYGAEVIFTPAAEGSDGAILAAQAFYRKHADRYFYADQYNNPANWQAHYKTTASEIWRQTRGRITHFIAGLGTSGTFVGTGRRLREYRPGIRLISVQPDSPFHGLEGLKHMPASIVPGIYDPCVADENITVSTEAAYDWVKRLAREKGLLVGLSSGAALEAVMQLARSLKEPGVLVTVFPDGGQRYLEQKFWEEN